METLPPLAGMVFCEMVCGKEDAEMKDLKLCYEVQRMALDEKGNSVPAGICVEFGKVPDERYEECLEVLKNYPCHKLLLELGMESIVKNHQPEDFRLISQDEYEEKYENI